MSSKNIWRPHTQELTDPSPLQFVRGEGAYLYTETGKTYLDAISSWWVNLHGHCHPKIMEAIKNAPLDQTPFADSSHDPANQLADKLLSIMPGNYSKVHFSDNGSTAVETSLKLAFQYWHNLGKPKRKVISFKNGYHGETFGAMSVSGKNIYNAPFAPLFFESIQIDPPIPGKEEISIIQMKKALSDNKIALFIFEPIIQGAGGMRLHSREGLQQLIKLCKQHQVITIADEVMTGFGRTGDLFASSDADIICLAKGITGGTLPLGATICKEHIYQAFLSESRNKAFLHGHSYSGNPICCSAALASIDLLLQQECSQAREMISRSHRQFSKKWQDHPSFKRLESLGTILVLEFKEPPDRNYLMRHFHEEQILVRPINNVLYLMPPYCTKKEDLEKTYQSLERYNEYATATY